MQKIKSILSVLLVTILLSSCGEYHKVLNKGKNTERYQMAEDMFKKGEYRKAIPLFEKLMGPYAGKPQMERIQYMISKSYYENGEFDLSAYYFNKFISNYPESSKVQEAAILGAKSYYLGSPKYSRDQQDTQKALTAFQNFIDSYPNSEFVEEANKYYDDLTKRLEKKSFEVAKQYYHMEYYQAAIVAFDTFNEEHLGSPYKEEALYLKFKAAYNLGMKSILAKKEDRILDAMKAHQKFERAFPSSDKLKETNKDFEDLQKELVKTRKTLSRITQ